MIKMLEIKTCTAFWDIDGTIMRFQRRKRVSDETMGIKIAQYKELLLGNLYEAHPETLCEINNALDEVILVRIGFEVYREDFLRMFRYYAQSYTQQWDKADKVVRAKKISIFPVFQWMFKSEMVDIEESPIVVLRPIEGNEIFMNIFEMQFAEYWKGKIQENVLNKDSLEVIRKKIGLMRTTKYFMCLPENMVLEYLESIAGKFTENREIITRQKYHSKLFSEDGSRLIKNCCQEFAAPFATAVKKEYEVQSKKFIAENHLELNIDNDQWRLYSKKGPSLSLDTTDFSGINSPSMKLEIKYFMKHRFLTLTGNKDGGIYELIRAVNILTANNPGIRFFADIDDVDVKTLHLTLEQKYMQNQENRSMSSIMRVFSILTVVTHYLMRDERDKEIKSPRPCQNPFARYRFHNAREYKERTPAIPESVMEQLDAHIDELDPIYKLIYLIFSNTGMRTKEVLFLEADCLEKSRYENLIQIKYKPYKVLAARRRAGAGDYHRVLIMSALADIIRGQIEKTAEWRSTYNMPYIFINKRPNFRANMINMNNFRNHINALIEKYNICDDNDGPWHFTCKQHRKTLAVTLIENGATVDELAYWLGHLTRTTASNYYAEVRKMRLAELNTEFFKKKFDLLLSEEQLSGYSEEERRLLYIDFRLEQRKVEFGYCLQKLADGGCSKRNSLYNCINCKNLCTGKKYLPYWQELLSQQQLVVGKLLEIYAKNNMTEVDFVDFKEYKQEFFLLRCYENMVKAIECGVM